MNDINKLPKWAQSLIGDLKRQRELAVRKLEQFTNHHQDGNVRVWDILCTTSPPSIHEVRFNSRKVDFTSKGILVTVAEAHNCIEVKWCGDENMCMSLPISVSGRQSIEIKTGV